MKLEPYKAELHVDGEVLEGDLQPPTVIEPSEMTEEQRQAYRASVANQVTLSRSDQMALAHQFKIRAHRARLFARMQNGVNQERISQLLRAAYVYDETARQLEALAKTPFIK